jgi:hypothetical protein
MVGAYPKVLAEVAPMLKFGAGDQIDDVFPPKALICGAAPLRATDGMNFAPLRDMLATFTLDDG